MRDIKFRAWEEKSKTMFYDLVYISMSGGSMSANPERPLIHPIIEQYTGLKDKNGKDIYEGDITKKQEEIIYCEFGNGLSQDEGTSEHAGYYKSKNTWKTPLSRFDEVEIIGNIHENPELLEVNP